MIRHTAAAVCLALSAAFGADICQPAQDVIQRFTGGKVPVKLHAVKDNGPDHYRVEVKNGTVEVTGNSPVALTHGFYAALKEQGRGICSWSGNRVEPGAWANGSATEGSTPFRHRYYFNVVTFGYSMVYWDWKRWEKEIDYMALHGINMPLALVAQEAITARVFKRLGLTDDEIQNYFVGPAHLPWMRMGNISALDSPMPGEWHAGQIALQHKILDRMRSLGMTPVCPGFAGFVPQALKRLHPELKLVETNWNGGLPHNWMITPDQPLFQKIGTMFIEEWEKEFGKCSHYLIDSFNEMDLPFPPHGQPARYEMLADYGRAVYDSIAAANPDAVWMMQGWMFGFQRRIWDSRSLEALISKVPDDKMMLLDEAVDYSKHFWRNGVNWDFHKGFYNKFWIYSVIPNMGGKSGHTGILEFYANGHLEALESANRGRLVGHGMAPEGIENNQVVYELMSDAAWSQKKMDLAAWLKNYSICRYGSCPKDVEDFWAGMCKSVYGSFTDHPYYNWLRGAGAANKGSINANADYFKGIESLAKAADKLKDSPLFRADLEEFTAGYLGAKVEQLIMACDHALQEGDNELAKKLDDQVTEYMLAMDRLLESHPNFRLDRWLNFARKHGKDNQKLADYYEKNARRIITVWGPPVNDYAARTWSGLIRDYYLPRHQLHMKGRFNPAEKVDVGKWELNWVEQKHGVSKVEPYKDPVEAAVKLIAKAKPISADALKPKDNSKQVASWSPAEVGTDWKEVSWAVTAQELQEAQGVRFRFVRGSHRLDISEVKIEMDGQIVAEVKHDGIAGTPSSNNVYRFTVPADATGNNSCHIIARVRSNGGNNSFGSVELLPKKK